MTFANRMSVMFAALLLHACAVGNTHDITTTTPALKIETANSLAVGVQDQRPYVLDGDKDPDFVGLQRGGFGNPFDVTTKSKKPLAEDFQAAILASLSSGKLDAVGIPLTPTDSLEKVTESMGAAKKSRSLVLFIKEWKSDTYTNTALAYDLLLKILGPDGNAIAQNQVSGKDDLGGSFMNPPAHAKTAVPQAFQRILETLFKDPKIIAALN